jgi:glycosyltransferase involved in cell wall biosynthesis
MTQPFISLAICTCDEGRETIEPLVNSLAGELHKSDSPRELVILDDYSTEESTVDYLVELKETGFNVNFHHLNGDFATHKNYMNSLCSGHYILNLDADESLSQEFLDALPEILWTNPDVDLWYLPRLNIVNGITEEHLQKWNWKLTDIDGFKIIQWPDWQGRLYRNANYITWVGAVHERITGHSGFSTFPEESAYAIRHVKDIDRQEKQNKFYSTIKVT